MVLNISDIQLFQILKEKMGDKEAEALVTFVDNKIKDNNETNLKILSTKEDLLQLEIRLKDKMTDQFKWVIGVFLTLALMIIGLYLKK
jgi:hypothetical protein